MRRAVLHLSTYNGSLNDINGVNSECSRLVPSKQKQTFLLLSNQNAKDFHSKRPYLSRVTMADIKRLVDDFKLSVPIVVQDGREKLVFERTTDKRWQILKLLDDDYLGSVLTDEKYATNSKYGFLVDKTCRIRCQSGCACPVVRGSTRRSGSTGLSLSGRLHGLARPAPKLEPSGNQSTALPSNSSDTGLPGDILEANLRPGITSAVAVTRPGRLTSRNPSLEACASGRVQNQCPVYRRSLSSTEHGR